MNLAKEDNGKILFLKYRKVFFSVLYFQILETSDIMMSKDVEEGGKIIWNIGTYMTLTKRKQEKRLLEFGFKLQKGEYHIVVSAVIINSKGQILISKRADYKPNGLMWELNGGSIIEGETSIEGIIREIKEELGIKLNESDGILYKTVRRDDPPADFKDLWLFKKDIDIKNITFPDGESIEARWVTIDEFEEMAENKKLIGARDFGREDYEKIMKEY